MFYVHLNFANLQYSLCGMPHARLWQGVVQYVNTPLEPVGQGGWGSPLCWLKCVPLLYGLLLAISKALMACS